MIVKGVPEHLRSDNRPEFVARDLRKWLAATGTKTLYIEPGSPWENGYCESFNSKLRDEFLNGDIGMHGCFCPRVDETNWYELLPAEHCGYGTRDLALVDPW
jgi:transposase InsO family protein